MYSQKDWLLIFGAGLFLLGLVTGFVGPLLANPRMGLSSHLEGLMNGTFLIAIGAIWDRALDRSGHGPSQPGRQDGAFWIDGGRATSCNSVNSKANNHA